MMDMNIKRRDYLTIIIFRN